MDHQPGEAAEAGHYPCSEVNTLHLSCPFHTDIITSTTIKLVLHRCYEQHQPPHSTSRKSISACSTFSKVEA